MSLDKLNRAWVASLLVAAFTVVAPITVGQQSAVIEPCPAECAKSPNPLAKTGRVIGTRANGSVSLIDESIPADSALDQMLEPYSAKVRALNVAIGKLEGE